MATKDLILEKFATRETGKIVLREGDKDKPNSPENPRYTANFSLHFYKTKEIYARPYQAQIVFNFELYRGDSNSWSNHNSDLELGELGKFLPEIHQLQAWTKVLICSNLWEAVSELTELRYLNLFDLMLENIETPKNADYIQTVCGIGLIGDDDANWKKVSPLLRLPSREKVLPECAKLYEEYLVKSNGAKIVEKVGGTVSFTPSIETISGKLITNFAVMHREVDEKLPDAIKWFAKRQSDILTAFEEQIIDKYFPDLIWQNVFR